MELAAHAADHEQTQELIALLKILTLGNRQIEEGKTQSAEKMFEHLRKRSKYAKKKTDDFE